MDNQKTFYEPYDPNLPIESLWSKISELVAYAKAGNSPFSATQIFVAAVASIEASGIFLEDLKNGGNARRR